MCLRSTKKQDKNKLNSVNVMENRDNYVSPAFNLSKTGGQAELKTHLAKTKHP